MRRRRRGVDLDPPVAAGAGARESVVLGEGWGEVAVVGVRGGRGGEVAVGVREGRVRRGGRRRAEVAPVGTVVVTHGRWWEAEEGGEEMGRKAREIRATVVRFLLVAGGTHRWRVRRGQRRELK